MLINPWGQVLAVQPEGAAVVMADLPMEQLHERRMQLPALDHRALQ
jgi:nitrilase